METENQTRIPAELRALLRKRVVFLAWTACVFAVFALAAHALGVDQPYPEHPFVSGHTGVAR